MPKQIIDKETLEHLAKLAKIEISGENEDKLLSDLQGILGYFEELKELNTDNVEPMAGGTFSSNVFREDSAREKGRGDKTRDKLVNSFPEKEGDLLRVPPIFE